MREGDHAQLGLEEAVEARLAVLVAQQESKRRVVGKRPSQGAGERPEVGGLGRPDPGPAQVLRELHYAWASSQAQISAITWSRSGSLRISW